MTICTVTICTVTICTVTICTVTIRMRGRRLGRHGCWRRRLPAHTGQHVGDQVAQRGKLVERHAVISRQPILLADLTEELRLANAVDAEIRLQIRIEFHDLPRITSLLHHEVDQEVLDLVGSRALFRRPTRQPSRLPARPGEHVTERVAASRRQDGCMIARGDFKKVRRAVKERLHASAGRS